jgi:hypothetical protein
MTISTSLGNRVALIWVFYAEAGLSRFENMARFYLMEVQSDLFVNLGDGSGCFLV